VTPEEAAQTINGLVVAIQEARQRFLEQRAVDYERHRDTMDQLCAALGALVRGCEGASVDLDTRNHTLTFDWTHPDYGNFCVEFFPLGNQVLFKLKGQQSVPMATFEDTVIVEKAVQLVHNGIRHLLVTSL
jgi:hypothetical protein